MTETLLPSTEQSQLCAGHIGLDTDMPVVAHRSARGGLSVPCSYHFDLTVMKTSSIRPALTKSSASVRRESWAGCYPAAYRARKGKIKTTRGGEMLRRCVFTANGNVSVEEEDEDEDEQEDEELEPEANEEEFGPDDGEDGVHDLTAQFGDDELPVKFAKVQQNGMQTQHKLGLKSANPSPTFCTFASLRQHCVAFTMVGGPSARRVIAIVTGDQRDLPVLVMDAAGGAVGDFAGFANSRISWNGTDHTPK
ncbi:hypothetical protein DFH08DRAFT_824754 [Mycena albidolilacea]|uniref:Uncharacterized protein n=1 Tax=Mycena albidolilacea TaxID=1033008 RepID=A0AAD6Z3Y6_9AGAR|nr:hypothetical protein DFH08DRAFT_824754 [Mycena albidolilacea]